MLERALTVAAVIVGVASISMATDGFRAVTTEGARRVAVERSPRPLPEITLTSHTGESFRWEDLEGKPILVEFVFTTCPDVCQKMISDFGTMVRTEKSDPKSEIRFVSISFDPAKDTVEQLARVARAVGADGDRWRFARINDPVELGDTLEAFGVVAIPSPVRRFEHNTAIHGVSPSGKLARIDDVTETKRMLGWARERR